MGKPTELRRAGALLCLALLDLAGCCPAKPVLVVADAGPGLSLCTSDAQCPAGDHCQGGLCHTAVSCSGPSCPCGDGGPCPPALFCSQGQCLTPSCQGVVCAAGGVCVSGACYPALCDGGACPAAEACVDGSCYPTSCAGAPACEPGEVCVGQACEVASCVGVSCPAGEACVRGVCEGSDAGADAGAGDAGPDDGPDAGPDDAGAPDAGGCLPSCDPATCGQPDGCGGSCPACCYQCGVSDAGDSCDLATAPPLADGGCPAGSSTSQAACNPCWSCAAESAYCTSAADCGSNWTTEGIVKGTCYGCGEWGEDPSEANACANAQANTLASAGGSCPNPQPGYTALCGFAGYQGDAFWYQGATPGGCDCSFAGCGTQCCLASGPDEVASDAAECCSGLVGACLGGTAQNCCCEAAGAKAPYANGWGCCIGAASLCAGAADGGPSCCD